jgi:hypothetical protein
MTLVLYDKMRYAIAKCASVDEAAGIRNQANKLEAYARIRDDKESQRQFGEIRLRACVRIGEISRELDKAEFKPGKGACLPTGGKTGKTKEQQLKQAGISTSTASRYEELVGETVEIGMQAAQNAQEGNPLSVGSPPLSPEERRKQQLEEIARLRAEWRGWR